MTTVRALCFACALAAVGLQSQLGAQIDTKLMCYEGTDPGTAIDTTLPRGYQLRLQRSRDSLDDRQCSATVRSPRGATVWSMTGFRAAYHGATGRDIDGDGEADAVIGVDTGGGNRCCWNYAILKLTPQFARLATLEFPGAFDEDEDGHVLIWQIVGYYNLARYMAIAPAIYRAYQWRRGQLQDITIERCDWILTDRSPRVGNHLRHWELVTAERLAAARAGDETTFDVEQTQSAAMSLALQYLICDQRDNGEQLIRNAWPGDAASGQWDRLQEAVAGRGL